MNTTILSNTLLGWPCQQVLASFYTLQGLTLRLLLHIAKILQHAETWTLSSLNAPTNTIYRMFSSEDISDYTRVEAQVVALISLAVLIFCHLYGYLRPHPPTKIKDFDTCLWIIWVLFRGHHIFKYLFSYLRIPFLIAYLHACSDQFEADGDICLLFRRGLGLSILIAI